MIMMMMVMMMMMMMMLMDDDDDDDGGNDDDDDADGHDDERHHQLNVSQCPPLPALHPPKELSTSTHNGVTGVRDTRATYTSEAPLSLV